MFIIPVAEVQVTHKIPSWDLISLILRSNQNRSSSTMGHLTPHPLTSFVTSNRWVKLSHMDIHYLQSYALSFHSHEILVVIAGRARLCFGGENNPKRFEPVVQRGDLIIVPARVGHRLLEDQGNVPFEMIGSYSNNKEWDMCYGSPGAEMKVREISQLLWFNRDLFYGEDGPALRVY